MYQRSESGVRWRHERTHSITARGHVPNGLASFALLEGSHFRNLHSKSYAVIQPRPESRTNMSSAQTSADDVPRFNGDPSEPQILAGATPEYASLLTKIQHVINALVAVIIHDGKLASYHLADGDVPISTLISKTTSSCGKATRHVRLRKKHRIRYTSCKNPSLYPSLC